MLFKDERGSASKLNDSFVFDVFENRCLQFNSLCGSWRECRIL